MKFSPKILFSGKICGSQEGAVATVAVKDLLFQSPLFFGDVVSFYASVIKTGKKSITVDIQVYAERMHTILKTAQAVMIYVAVSKPGESRMIAG